MGPARASGVPRPRWRRGSSLPCLLPHSRAWERTGRYCLRAPLCRLRLYPNAKGAAQTEKPIYFSGHKWFHVELVFLNRTDMHHSSSYKPLWDAERRALLGMLQSRGNSGRPDPFHDYVRLNTSIIRWGPLGSESRHRVTRILEEDLLDIGVVELWARSKAS